MAGPGLTGDGAGRVSRRPTGSRPAFVGRMVAHLVAALPVGHLAVDAISGHLGVNPIQEVTVRTGTAALACLVASLAVTPVSGIGRQRWAAPSRRPLGLWAFAYAAMHLATFVVLDYGLDWAQIWRVVIEKRFVIAGFTAFLAMAPLAATSTRGWQRRLGRWWRRLHWLAYVAAGAAVIHFIWLVKADLREPMAWAAGLAALLAMRVPPVRRRVAAVADRVVRWSGAVRQARGSSRYR